MMFLTLETMEDELKRIDLWRDGNKFFAAQIFLNGSSNVNSMRNVVVNRTDTELNIITCDFYTNELLPEEVKVIKNEEITLAKITKGNFGFFKVTLYKENEILTSFQITKAIKDELLENVKGIINSYPNEGIELLDAPSLWKSPFVVSLIIFLVTAFFLVIGVLMVLDGEFKGLFVAGVGLVFAYILIIYIKRCIEDSIKKKEAEKDNPIKQ